MGINKIFTAPHNALAQTKWMGKLGKQYQKNNMALITGISVASIVLKDGYGCYLYVKQSLNNKKIPEDKRKFVAALDLTNGGLMILIQILMAFSISNKKVQEKMFNKLFGKYFDRAAVKGYKNMLQSKESLSGLSGKQFHTGFGKYKKDVLSAFEHITTLVAATMLGKRIIVPFIATPMADKAKAWMCKNDKPAEVNKDTKNTYNTAIPAAEIAKMEAVKSTNLLDKFQASKS